MKVYEARRVCPECPRTQIVRISFADPAEIDYECLACGKTWHISPGIWADMPASVSR